MHMDTVQLNWQSFYEENGVDFLAVARAREAFELRKAGTIPILNLGYTNLPTVEDCIKRISEDDLRL